MKPCRPTSVHSGLTIFENTIGTINNLAQDLLQNELKVLLAIIFMSHLQWLKMSAKQDKNQTKANQPTKLKFPKEGVNWIHSAEPEETPSLPLCASLYSFLSLYRDGLYFYTPVQVSELSFLKHSLSSGDFKVSLKINEPSPFVQLRDIFCCCWFYLKNMFRGGISVFTSHKA